LGGGDGAVTQTVRAEPVSGRQPGAPSQPAHQTPGAGLGHASAVAIQEDRARGPLADVGLQRPGGGGGEGFGAAFATLAGEFENPVTEVVSQMFDVSGQRLVDA